MTYNPSMRWHLFFILLLPVGCNPQPTLPEDDRPRNLPKVVNIRPQFPADKAVLHVQAETTFLRTDADLTESWSLASAEGLDEQQIKLLAKNGIRIGTMDAAGVSQFYAKLPRTGGTKVLTIGVGREPVVFETTPTLESAVEIEAMLGIDRDETLRLPPGRTQLLLDVVIDGEKVIMGVTPHHHWVSPSIKPRTPQEKAMEGREFREISLDANLTGDRYLVLGWMKPPEPIKPPLPQEMPQVEAKPQESETPVEPTLPDTITPQTTEAPAAPIASDPLPGKPKLGDLLFLGQRADRPLQLICIIRVPPQGEMFGNTVARPER